MPLDFERGPTSKERLKIDWLHPVPPERKGTQTAAVGPMSFFEALNVLWEAGDDRPLLVLRECTACTGGDDALLSRALGNDRVQLMMSWFRTVRLPPHVLNPAHPFYNVFAGRDNKGGTPHFFLLAEPGAEPVFFSGQQTQAELLKGVYAVLGQRYAKDPQKAVKSWLQVLDALDTLDGRRRQLEDQLAEERASGGPNSERAQKLEASLQRNAEERAETLAREKKIRDLGLLSMSREALVAVAR